MTVLLALLLLPVLQSGSPSPTVVALASPSADTVLTADPQCQDADLIRFAAGDAWARLWMPQGAWNAVLGDVDLDGLLDGPAGVDAITWDSTAASGGRRIVNLWFSSDADFLGWKDGDVLRVTEAGTLEQVYTEDQFRVALGTTSSFDVDALERDASGRIWFSLRDGISASNLGAIEDGDVLVFDPVVGTCWRHATEPQVQAWVDQAMPGAGALGDLKSLAIHPVTGELLFTIQSPSAADASVFSSAGGGSLLPEFEEARWGFLQATELDALTLTLDGPSQPPVLSAETAYAVPGQTFGLTIRHAMPNGSLLGVVGATRLLVKTQRGGFGYVAFDPRGVTRNWPAAQSGDMTADASGSVTASFTVPIPPPGYGTLDLVFQAWDRSSAQLSTPVLVRVP